MGETDYGAIFGVETDAGAGAADPANDAQGVKKQGTKDKLRCRSQGTVKSPIIRTNTLKI